MKNIERGSVKYLVLLIIWTAIFGLVLFPLFDFIFDKIGNNDFTYSVSKHVISPIVFAIVYGLTFWIISKKRK